MAGHKLPSLSSRLKLSNGATIPQVQLGLYMMSGKEARAAVSEALKIGYRGFDCAQMYHNERETGSSLVSAIASGDVERADIFYTTKLSANTANYETVRRSVTKSIEASGLGYVDLFLLHSPYGGKDARLTSWRALEDAVAEGEVKMIGVSNYGVAHIEELMASNPRVKPVINQIEVHPFNTQEAIRKTCKKHGITIEAYAPLVRAMRMKHPTIVEIAKKYACTPAQLLIRWGIQHDMVTLPKTTVAERMIENADVNEVVISTPDIEMLDGLDQHLVTDWDPTEAA